MLLVSKRKGDMQESREDSSVLCNVQDKDGSAGQLKPAINMQLIRVV